MRQIVYRCRRPPDPFTPLPAPQICLTSTGTAVPTTCLVVGHVEEHSRRHAGLHLACRRRIGSWRRPPPGGPGGGRLVGQPRGQGGCKGASGGGTGGGSELGSAAVACQPLAAVGSLQRGGRRRSVPVAVALRSRPGGFQGACPAPGDAIGAWGGLHGGLGLQVGGRACGCKRRSGMSGRGVEQCREWLKVRKSQTFGLF